MLRRHSTKSKSDLRRRKSTTSVRSVPLEHIDAATAQRDAQIAAMEAFYRAQGRRSAERALFPAQPLSANKENTSLSGLARVDSTASLATEHRRQGLERRQSVRFVGPESGLQTRASRISMRTADIPARRPIHRSQSTQSISYMPRSVLRDSENLPLPDRTSSVGKTIVTPEAVKTRLSQAYLQALSPEYEQYTPEDDIASVPSSYRRVHKTRSMLTTRTSLRGSIDGNAGKTHRSSPHNTVTMAQSKQTTPGALFPRYSLKKRRDSNMTPSAPKLGAPKSMSFLNSHRDRSERQSSIDSPSGDISPVPGAQDTSFRSRILPKHPKLFGSKCEEPHREMPKTLRGSSGDMEMAASRTSTSLGRSRSGSLRNKARKVSISLRSRFKNLFTNKSEEEARLPAQQIEAQRTHVSEVFDVENPWVSAKPAQDHCRERSSLSRVSTRIPSLHAVPSDERLHSRRGSIDSCGSAAGQTSDEKSRVTSWASTDPNTIIAHRPQDATEEWEKQRLSIINEHNIENPLQCLDRPAIGLQTITSQKELASMDLQRLPPGATVDSQRVYSALMRKMKETQQLAGIVEQQRKSSDGSDPFRTLSPSSSIGSGGSSDTAASNRVRPSRQLSIPGKDIDKFSGGARPTLEGTRSSGNKTAQEVADDHRTLSPPIHLTPTRTEGSAAAKPITDRGSAFFGSPTSHLFRTTSPYRRSLREAMRAESAQASCQEPAETTVETVALASMPDATGGVAYSESNYSSETLIHQMGMKHPVSQHLNVADTRAETSIFEDTPTYRPTGERHVSTASSMGWKTWLSADVAKLEPSPTRVSGQSPEIEYRMPTMPRSLGYGHVREAAQTGSCEEDEDNAKPPVRMPTSSTTPLTSIDSNVVKLSPQQRSVMRAATPHAADLHNDQMPTALEVNSLSSCYVDDASNKFRQDTTRPPASPSGKTKPSQDHKPTAQPQTPIRGPAIRQSRSLAGLKSISRIRDPQTSSPQPPVSSTVRLMRKSARKLAVNPASATSSPGFTGAFERQFESIGHHVDGQLAEKENQVPHRDGAEKQSPNIKGQSRGSKAMVDLFLSSRRRQGASSGDANAFV